MQSRSAGALRAYFMNIFWNNWSGRQDSNLRPPHPQCDALPGCATSRPPKTSLRPVEARLYGAGFLKASAVWTL
jgi:hypothetical protein